MAKRVNEASWIETRKRWQINVQKEGVRKTFTSSTEGKKGKIEAEKKADEWLESNAPKEQDNNARFGTLWAEFLADYKIEGNTGQYRQYEQLGRLWLLPFLKHKKINKITSQDWQDCINTAFATKNLSKKSCQNIRGTITAFYRYIKKRRIKMEQPEDLAIPKKAKAKKKTILQPEDIKVLLSTDYIIKRGKQQPDFFIHAYRFYVFVGLRRGELCGIRDKEDLQNNALFIRRAVNEDYEITGGKNTNAIRATYLSTYALHEVEAQRDMLKRMGIISPWLFPDEQGNMLHPRHLYNCWVRYRKQHGFTSSIQELRHTHISIAQAEVPEQLLKMTVGHSKSMDTFGIYGHHVNGQTEQVAAILDHVFETIIK